MKLTTIALTSAFALSSTVALANTVRHEPSVRTLKWTPELGPGIAEVKV
jgi:hypothetical protein